MTPMLKEQIREFLSRKYHGDVGPAAGPHISAYWIDDEDIAKVFQMIEEEEREKAGV